MEDVLKKLELHGNKSIRIVGVGENAHGEEVSWPFRVDFMQHLKEKKVKMAVLCENLDFYVKAFRKRPTKFHIYRSNDTAEFMPYLMPDANRTQIQMDAAAEIARLSNGRVYGIDIQQVDFPFMWHNCGRMVRNSMQSCGAIDEWKNGSDKDRSDGAMRNRLNARIIAHMAKQLQHNEKTVVIYLAHNAHIAKTAKEETRRYKTDGRYLAKDPSVMYMSIATYSPHLWTTWGGTTQKLLRESLENDYDVETAFDAIFVNKSSKKLQLNQVMHTAKKYHDQ